MRGVIRSLIPVAAVAAVLGLGLGCGDDESEVCQSLQDLQASVQSLGDIELEDTSARLQQAANEIVTDADEARDAADEELGQEIDTFKATVEALVADLEAASAEGELTRDSLAEIGTSVGSVVTGFETLQAAAPDDCDLQE